VFLTLKRNLDSSSFLRNMDLFTSELDPDLKDPCSVQSNESADYCLYSKCASNEASTIARFIRESIEGPLVRQKMDGLSFLDIGAGDGRVLQALCADHNTIKVASYSAFELNEVLSTNLRSTAKNIGFEGDKCLISSSRFDLDTSVKDAGGCADVVILSHCLYGSKIKIGIIDHALKFVSPGGILFIVHRWEAGGTLEKICEACTTKSIIYHRHIWDSQLDLSNLNESERQRMNAYTKGYVPLKGKKTQINRTMGYIAIEPSSCTLRQKEIRRSIQEVNHRVGHLARLKKPAAVVRPNTVVGIQACLRAASLCTFGNGKVTVIGGGHSENCIDDNAIAIDMQLWNHVEVDQTNLLVRVGGGASIGAVTRECEKYGLVVPLGDRPGVGIGLILLGGLNHFMRKFGLATDNIVKVRYISPTGQLQEVTTEEDLFPFRGAGSNFGVVVEVTLRTFSVRSIIAQDITYVLPKSTDSKILSTYSQVAERLPEDCCLDGFLFWSSHDQLSFSTSHFEFSEQATATDIVLKNVEANANLEVSSINTPTDLYNRELYITKAFAPERVLRLGEDVPEKLRSKKRCLFLPPLTHDHEKIFLDMIKQAPTKWSYVHFLQGGGAVGNIPPEVTAFGCRDWLFAAVITARWPAGDDKAEKSSTKWLEDLTNRLIPYSKGAYGSDLGPKDTSLARRAFGLNNMCLVQAKQRVDPLNVLGSACPLTTTSTCGSDPRVQSRGIVVIICGPRCSGKDWLAEIAAKTLKMMLLVGNNNHINGHSSVVISSISNGIKKQYAKESSHHNTPVDAEKLITGRVYKEKHRKSLSAFYQKKRAQDIAYDAKRYVDIIQDKNNDGKILFITGMRDGLDCAQTLAGGRPVVLVNVTSCKEAKQSHGGWTYDHEIDKLKGECDAVPIVSSSNGTNGIDSSFLWDLTYDNGLKSTSTTADDWTRDILVPYILKACVRSIPDIPKPGVAYRDIIGSLLLQPFALPLWSSSVLNWLQTTPRDDDDVSNNVDTIVAPEALGFVFAGALSTLMMKPLVLIRKEGKLVGNAIDRVPYKGSNMKALKQEQDSQEECSTMTGGGDEMMKRKHSSSSFEIIAGSIIPGQRIMVVDDCLATGSTLEGVSDLVSQQGGIITKFVCVMELPDLDGRLRLGRRRTNSSGGGKDFDIFSMMQFPGK
jgi:phosphomevalonate kinase